MITCTIYSSTSGQIHRICDVPGDTMSTQAQEGEDVISGGADSDTQYVNVSAAEIATREEFILVAPSTDVLVGVSTTIALPDPCYIKKDYGDVIEVIGGTYTFSSDILGAHTISLVGRYFGAPLHISVSSVGIDSARTNTLINAAHVIALASGFTYNENIYDSDADSIQMITATATIAALPADFTWKTKDNVFVAMSTSEFADLNAALFTHITTNFNKKTAHKVALAALTTLPEIKAYGVSTTASF